MRKRIIEVLENAGKQQINLLSKTAREHLADEIIRAVYNYKTNDTATNRLSKHFINKRIKKHIHTYIYEKLKQLNEEGDTNE